MTAHEFNLSDALSEIGGLYASVRGALFLVFAGFTKKLYYDSLIKRLYSYEGVVYAEKNLTHKETRT
jgi:hypothetical protein